MRSLRDRNPPLLFFIEKWEGEANGNGEVVFFKSTKAAARKYGTDVMNIKGACNGKRKTAVGFRWEYSIINIPGESQGEIYGLETESS